MKRANPTTAGSELGRVPLVVVAGLLGLLCWLVGPGSALAAGTFVVDGANPDCSDTAPGAGTEGNPPYCTISAAAYARGGPGTTILVKPAIYREQVNVPASGADGSPFVFQALGPGVVVDGADDFSDPGLWTPATGSVWLAPSVPWFSRQVFVDGARLIFSHAEPADLAPGTFHYVLGEGLYVNLGGDNPGTHQTLVGLRHTGFLVDRRSWVTIDGFTITRTEGDGIDLNGAAFLEPPSSNNLTVTNNTVTFSHGRGIRVGGAANVLIGSNVVSDNRIDGIYLSGVNSSTIQDNEVFRSGGGIHLAGSPGNLLQRNNAHDNVFATGILLEKGSANNVSRQNFSWRNGSHGFHVSDTEGTRHVGDVAWGNAGRGFSVVRSTPSIFNSIGVNNGLAAGEYDLFVDGSSFVSNSNIFWNRTSQAPIKYAGTTYATLAAFTAATGQDANSIQTDPQFVHSVGGDFRLFPGSPAIDSADSAVPHWPETDAAGQARLDDPATANTGVGPVLYADRGALEYYPYSGPPLAALTITPSVGNPPLAVIADASRSVDPDGAIVSYRFDFGDGTVVGPQAEATASHTYTASGTFIVSVTVTDDEERTAAASHPIRVNAPPEGTINTPAGNITVGAGQALSFSGTGTDPDGDEPLRYFWDFGGGAANQTGPNPGLKVFYVPGIYTVTFTVTDSLGLADPTPDRRVITVHAPPEGVIDSPAGDVTIVAGESVAFAGTGSEPDGHLPLTFQWDFRGGAPNTTVEDPGTVTFSTPGTYWVTFTVTDSLGLADPTPASRLIRVLASQAPDGVIDTPPTDVTIMAGQSLSFTGTGTDPDGNLPLSFTWYFGGAAPDATVEDPGAVVFSRPGVYPVSFSVRDGSGVSDPTPDSRVITVVCSPSLNLVCNSSFEASTTGWRPYGGATIQRVSGGQEGAFALEVRGPASTAEFGIDDNPNWVATSGAAGTRYLFSAWVRAAASAGQARLRVQEYRETQVGGTIYSPFVPLTPDWQLLTLVHVTQAAGSTLDFKVLATPSASGQVFQVDSIAIRIVTTTSNQPPNGVIESPAGDMIIRTGQSVTFAGTGGDPDGHLPLTFLWTFGGGAPNSTAEDPGAVTFSTRGTYTITLTMIDSLGLADPTPDTRVITVVPANFVGNPSFESNTWGWAAYGGSTLQRVSGGQEGAFALEVRGPATTTEFGINDSPNWVAKTLAAGTRYRFSAWVRAESSAGQARLKVREYLNGVQVGGTIYSPFVPLTPEWQQLTLDYVAQAAGSTLDFQVLETPSAPGQVFQVDTIAIRLVSPTDEPPNGVIDSPARNVTIPAGQSVPFAGTGTDPDGHLPLTFLWDFGGGAPDSTAQDPGEITFSSLGTYTVTFTVTNSLGLADPTPDSLVITVVAADQNLVGNPSFETDTSGWMPYPTADTVIERVPGGQEGAFALEVRSAGDMAPFGINDSPNWVGSTGAAGTRYRLTAWVRAEASSGQARIRVREYLNGVQVGTATYSPFVPLTLAWQMLTVDHVTQAAGSTLDAQVLDYPVAPGETFQTDSIWTQVAP
jgi:parallel beta-helix repeat protein